MAECRQDSLLGDVHQRVRLDSHVDRPAGVTMEDPHSADPEPLLPFRVPGNGKGEVSLPFPLRASLLQREPPRERHPHRHQQRHPFRRSPAIPLSQEWQFRRVS